jgi:hypothetical protein
MLALVAFFLMTAFVWGYFAHRNDIFPNRLISTASRAVGIIPSAYRAREPRQDRLAVLSSLPYVKSTYDPQHEQRGVLIYDRERASPGYNFYNSWTRSEAYLIGMDGKVLHEWRYQHLLGKWHHAELLPNGDVLAVFKDRGVLKIDKNSKEIWIYETRAHHDLWVHDDGDIYVLSHQSEVLPRFRGGQNTMYDTVVILSPDGQKKEEFSLLEVFEKSPYAYLLPSLAPTDVIEDDIDIMHTNHIEVFDGSKEKFSPLYKRGNLLVSMRHLNAVAILDGKTREILWLWGPANIARQHHPRPLENGNMLIFDNGLSDSRIVEITVPEGRVVWSYAAGEEFFASWGGSNQRLPNGNTLITESNTGYAFEVTPEGDKVWEFANPLVGDDGERMNIWRLTRFDPSQLNFLE